MPYTPPTFVNGSTPLNATNMTALGTQYTEATNSLEQDLLTAFVLAGLVASKDATTATKLNVSAGTAFPLQADSTLRRRSLTATSFTTATPSTTYYLDLNPDGTWSWGTAHSAQANYLPIAQVTTDGSGNIASVTDKRTTATTLLAGQIGSVLNLPMVGTMQALPPQPGPYAGRIMGGVTNAAALITGTNDGGMTFNGSTGYVTTPSTGLPTGNNPWSLEVWANLAAYPAATHFFKLLAYGGQGTNNTRPAITVDSGGALRAEVWGNTTAGYTVTTATTHHVVATWDGTTLTIFVDGVSRATATPGALNVPSTNGLNIGADVNGNLADFYNGTLDEVALYNAALTPTQISTHYARGMSGPTGTTTYSSVILGETSLVRYYRLGDTVARGVANQAAAEHATTVQADGTIAPIAVASVGGQPAVGYGVPVIVAQAIGVHVTTTPLQSILSYTVPADGMYRVNVSFELANGTNGQIVQCDVSYISADTGASNRVWGLSANGPTPISLYGTGGGPTINNGHWAIAPAYVHAKAGTSIVVQYQDPAGTPNDYVYASIERLA